MELMYLDIPVMHTHTPEGMDLVDALAFSKDTSLFALKSVQILIDAQSEHWLKIDYLAFFLPEVIQLLVFWYWSNLVLPYLKCEEADRNSSTKDQEAVCSVIMFLINIYMVAQEVPALIRSPLKYLTSALKIANIGAVILLFFNIFNENYCHTDFWTI